MKNLFVAVAIACGSACLAYSNPSNADCSFITDPIAQQYCWQQQQVNGAFAGVQARHRQWLASLTPYQRQLSARVENVLDQHRSQYGYYPAPTQQNVLQVSQMVGAQSYNDVQLVGTIMNGAAHNEQIYLNMQNQMDNATDVANEIFRRGMLCGTNVNACR